MADDTKQFNKQTLPEFSVEAIRSFLLGRLVGAEQVLFEESLFVDDGLATRMRLAECELTDDYAFDRLNAADRDFFEEKFLRTAGRKQMLNVSRALCDRFATTAALTVSARTEHSVSETLKRRLSFNQPVWRFVFGVVTLLILMGAAWLVVKEPRIKETIKQRILARRPAAQNAPREGNHPVNASQPGHQTTPSPLPAHEQETATPVITSAILYPTISRQADRVPLISLPKAESDILRLQLVLKANRPAPFRAEILAVDGRVVFSALSLKSADNRRAEVDVDVPARALKAGLYQIRLSRLADGSKGSLAGYYFRVQ